MASTSLSKGTRKTYSFEEREILVNLIYKYLSAGGAGTTANSILEDNKDSETSSTGVTATTPGAAPVPKRKSVWSRLTEEYNTLVGPENTRSSIQLRRCWENMKANKKNRDDRRALDKSASEMMQQLPPASTLGLPPNVVFQPKDTEAFAFEGMMLPVPNYRGPTDIKKEEESNDESDDKPLAINDRESMSIEDELPCDSSLEPVVKKARRKSSSPKKLTKPKSFKPSKVQRNNELYDFTISEAQLKLETAALLKEEAKLKLEEAEYRKEEAKMRMMSATYELQKLREDAALEDDN